MGKVEEPGLPLQGPQTVQQTNKSKKWTSLVKLSVLACVAYLFASKLPGVFERQELGHHRGGHSGPHRPHHGHGLWGHRAEKLFLSIPDATSAISTSRLFATRPHLAGSLGDLDTAMDFVTLFQQEFAIAPPSSVRDLILEAGSSESRDATLSITTGREPRAWIDEYYPVMNTPLERRLQILGENGTVLWDADLAEQADESDPEAHRYADAVPTFHGLSRGGDVNGMLVHGHYCRKEDYEDLVSREISLEGKIVLCRYGGIFRGLKVKGGQELGAVGILIYSDPRDDGTVTVENGYEAYPHGPARNPTSVQRGSVQFISIYPGDPTTPGYPSYRNSTRTEASNVPSIPSLPISWSNAKVLLQLLDDDERWKGARVRLSNQVDTKVTPIWNTMGVIPGHIKDEVVVVGNHRDAWVMGATDPSSGTVSTFEVVRGLGALWRHGWRPLRTIVVATWDAEEYGLIGSTEWGEDFAEWIQANVVAYLNLDSSVSGSRLSAGGSPLLSHLIRSTAEELPHPVDANRTLWDATQDSGSLFGNITGAGGIAVHEEIIRVKDMEAATTDSVGVSPLGSGSDYTVFLQRLGVPSTNGGFSSTLNDAVYHYHSVFDTQRWQETYADPGFRKHIAVAQHLGLQTLRLAGAPVLPFNTTHYARELEKYLTQVEALAHSKSVSPAELGLAPLRQSILSLQTASLALDREKARAEEDLWRALKKLHHGRHGHGHHGGSHRKWWRKVVRRWCKKIKLILKKHWPGKEKKDDYEAEEVVADEEEETHPRCPRGRGAVADVRVVFRRHAEIYEAVQDVESDYLEDGVDAQFSSSSFIDADTDVDASGHHEHHEHEHEHKHKDDKHKHPDHEHPHKDKKKHDHHHHHHRNKGGKHAKKALHALRASIHRVREVNGRLRAFERGFLSAEGLRGREWFRHLGVAPGRWLGYGATTLPGVTEALVFDEGAGEVRKEVARLRVLVEELTKKIGGKSKGGKGGKGKKGKKGKKEKKEREE